MAARTALVTGGGRGIGQASAERLARDGVRVVVTGRSADDLAATARATGGVALVADLADRAAVDGLVERIAREVGHIDILVNNAGIADSAPLARTSDETWDRVLELDATAPFRLCRALVPAMVAAGWGRVINIASNAGVSGYAYTVAYCAAKHALVGLTRALAVELASTGVTINAVCPGWVDTEMVSQATARIAQKTGRSDEDARRALARMSPQNRIFSPEEVAHTVAMLASDLGGGINGQSLVIDGGQILH